jgi:hypothetical protein
VCLVCCGPSLVGWRVCFACRWVGLRLGLPLAPVLPVRLCPIPSPLYAVLMGYKEAPVAEARHRFAPMVRQLFDDFLADHAPCASAAADGPVELAFPVPSTARPGGAPLEGLEGLARTVRTRLPTARWSPGLLVRTRAPLGHMWPDAGAFEVPAAAHGSVGGRCVVLLDDTYVSGARAQSAAGALRLAGARGVAIVALGRVLRPDRVPAHAAFLRRARVQPVESDVGSATPLPCRRCVQTGAGTE